MGKQNDVGVFQLENGKWAFRYTFTKMENVVLKEAARMNLVIH